jgi:anti-sigma factor RsiW
LDKALATDPELAAAVSDLVALRRALHAQFDDVLDEPVPPRLRPRAPRAKWSDWPQWSRLGGMAAALVFGIGIGVQGHRMWSGPAGMAVALTSANAVPASATLTDGPARFAQRAAIAHVVFMPEIQRPTGTEGQTEARFSQWIAGRLHTSAHAPDLSAQGFVLSGGRVLPGHDERVVQYMYRNDAGERITVCISPAGIDGQTAAFRFYEDGPVKVFYWIDEKFGYAISGGIARDTLLALSRDVYGQLKVRG